MKPSSIFVKDKEGLRKKIKKMKKDGVDALHVISDFDKTLTSNIDPQSSTSYDLIDKGLEPSGFKKKASAMMNYYYPIEMSSTIPLKAKIKKMEAWLEKYFSLALKCGISRKLIEDSVENNHLKLRKGTKEFFKTLSKQNIPLLVFSAGVGNMILENLRKNDLLTENVHIISNFFNFDKNGRAISYTRPLVHVFNKNETLIRSTPYKKQTMSRKNFILIGDSLGDLTMVEGLKHECVIKIGFFNYELKELFEEYAGNFDVIIPINRDLNYVSNLIKEVAGE